MMLVVSGEVLRRSISYVKLNLEVVISIEFYDKGNLFTKYHLYLRVNIFPVDYTWFTKTRKWVMKFVVLRE